MNNLLHESMRSDSSELCLGSWVAIGHPVVAEVKASLDLSFLVLDTEHASTSLETVENMVRAVDAAPGNTQTIVRVPWNDSVTLKRVLDIGVDGVLVPMIETAEEAADLVASLRYPPDGIRGIAGTRPTGYGRNIKEYVTSADSQIFTIVQIESPTGVANVEEIVSVDGIDAVFIGHSDLSGKLDCFGERDAPQLETAVEKMVQTCRRAAIPVGTIVADPDEVDTKVVERYDFLAVGKDITQLSSSTGKAVSEIKNNKI